MGWIFFYKYHILYEVFTTLLGCRQVVRQRPFKGAIRRAVPLNKYFSLLDWGVAKW
jgi:hypothetical protein